MLWTPAASPGGLRCETDYVYDGAGRVTDEILSGRNTSTGNQLEELWRTTTTTYTGETTTVTPPDGGVRTGLTFNARGQTIANDRYRSASDPNPVTYTYEAPQV